jgi:hypothetical protein
LCQIAAARRESSKPSRAAIGLRSIIGIPVDLNPPDRLYRTSSEESRQRSSELMESVTFVNIMKNLNLVRVVFVEVFEFWLNGRIRAGEEAVFFVQLRQIAELNLVPNLIPDYGLLVLTIGSQELLPSDLSFLLG